MGRIEASHREGTKSSGKRRAVTRLIDGFSVELDLDTSERMRGVRQKDTSPEQVVRRALHRLGHRFRTGNRDLPGTPDIANRSKRWAVFVHGCFWHRHEGCPRTTTPKRNRDFWLAKFEANRARDARAVTALRQMGYDVVTIWECESEDCARLQAKLQMTLPLHQE